MGNSDLDELKDKANCYKKQIAAMQAHIDCLKVELRDAQFYSDKLKQELKTKDGTKMFETLMNNTTGEARDLLAQHMYANLRCEMNIPSCQDNFSFPSQPIEVAQELIYATESYTDLFGKERQRKIFSTDDLRQIAEHLLVYCNNHKNSD